jgi:hypothetical protein
VELVDDDLPARPPHPVGQPLPPDEAVALVERVRASAERHAAAVLAALPAEVGAIALRACPKLPDTIIERITNTWAANRADWVMYRVALAEAAIARGWAVHWFDSRRVLTRQDLTAEGRPWTKDHKLALGGALDYLEGL